VQITAEEVAAGQAIYTKRTLALYDFIVLGVSNPLIWRCPTSRLLAHYNQNVSGHHLDVGVGTGYFLDRCRFPCAAPRIALMDLNPTALDYAAQRIARHAPQTHLRNVLEPITIIGEKFDSIGLNYLLHCLPGDVGSKSVVFDHLKALMAPGGVLFGATIVQGAAPPNWAARRLMAFYNAKGVFSNEQDDPALWRQALTERFASVSFDVVGCVALFSARA
jgi:SAM-dependent methyltransferase